MKQMVNTVKRSVYDREGFVNGFLKGALGGVGLFVLLGFLAGLAG